MNIGLKIGLAALTGAAIGTAVGFVNDEPNTATGAAMAGAGAGTMGLFGLALRNPGPFTSQPAGLLGVGIGALWAGMGVTTLFRANNDRPERPVYNPVDHMDDLTPAEPAWELPAPSSALPDYDPLRSSS